MGDCRLPHLIEQNIKVARDPKTRNFFNTIQPVSLGSIKPGSFTCPSILESLQENEFNVNSDISLKFSLCHWGITKLTFYAIVNSPNKALIRGGGIDEGTQEAAEPEFLDEHQKINDCETDECKTTLGCKLPVKYMCHVV